MICRCENSCNMRGVCHEDGVAPDQRFCGCHYGYEVGLAVTVW